MLFSWLPMAIGRIVCTFLTSVWISPQVMLAIAIFCWLLTHLLWIVFIWYVGLTRLSLYTLVALNGLSMSTISPTLVGWIKQFLVVTPIELSLILSSNAIGGILFALISGFVFHHYGSRHLFTILTTLVFLINILFGLIICLQRFHSKREHKHRTNEITDQNDDYTLEVFLKNDQHDTH